MVPDSDEAHDKGGKHGKLGQVVDYFPSLR
jgi:hypothetical protein